MKQKLLLVLIGFGLAFFGHAQKEIPKDRVLPITKLVDYLKPSIGLNKASEAELADYFRKVFSELSLIHI